MSHISSFRPTVRVLAAGLVFACSVPIPVFADEDPLLAALEELGEAIESAGDTVAASPYWESDQDRAEGTRRVLRQLVRALYSEVGTDDPSHTTFFRATDRFLKAGLENPDNFYLWARIETGATYRVYGERGTTADLAFQIYTQMPGLPGGRGYATGGFIDARSLVTDADGRFEILLGGAEREGNWLPLIDDARVLMVRYTYNNWVRERPGGIRIERLDRRGVPSASLTSADLAERLERAAYFLTDGTEQYVAVTRALYDHVPPNTLLPLGPTGGGGLPSQHLTSGWFDLADDQALIVTTRPSGAPYQGFQLGNRWFESLEFGERLTSYTSAQARLSSDGVYRFVVSARDPGVHNWLDTTGLKKGLLLLRWQGIVDLPPAEHQPNLEIVSIGEVRRRFPSDEPEFGPAQRRDQLARRQDEIAYRFPW